MNTKFKRHQHVRLLRAPLVEDVEPYTEPAQDIKAGMTGKVNVILPNGQYHVEIIDPETKETIAYCAIDEEGLEALEESSEVENDPKQQEPEDWSSDVEKHN